MIDLQYPEKEDENIMIDMTFGERRLNFRAAPLGSYIVLRR